MILQKMTNHQPEIFALCKIAKLFRFGDMKRQWLFDEDVLAGVEGRGRQLVDCKRPSGDCDRVDPVDRRGP